MTALGVSLGLAIGFPLVTWLMAHLGWAGSFYALAAINLVLGGGTVWRFLPAPREVKVIQKPGFMQTFTLAWQTPLLGLILLVEIATLSYLWGSSAWLPAWLRDEHHFSLHATGLLAAVPFLLSLGSKFLGGVLLDKMRPEQAPVLFVVGGLLTALSVIALMLSHQPVWLALFMLSANIFWGLQGAAIPAVIQHHAAREAVGSAYGIINGIGNLCAAFIPLLMGMVMKSMGSVSSGFSVLVVSQAIRPRSSLMARSEVSPPMTGVPVPGANAGSRQSISKVRYTGISPTICFTWAMMSSTPRSFTWQASSTVKPLSLSNSVRIPICTE